MRIGGETITVPKHGGVLVAPRLLRQVFNDADEEVLWLIVGAPAKNSKKRAARHESLFQKQLPKELEGVLWPPQERTEVRGQRSEIGACRISSATPTYNNTVAHKGAMNSGTYAHIYYYNGEILRLDIRRTGDDNS
jgi:hypothetical protein